MTFDKKWKDVGLGNTGETFLAGPDELMRSDSRLFLENPQQYKREVVEAGTPPEKLEAGATVTFAQVEGGWKVASSALTVKGTVPGIDEVAFRAAAEEAKDGCPISGALKGNVELSVEASLA